MVKLSAAQLALLHALESAIASALITLIVGISQYAATNSVNPPELLKYAGVAFLSALALIYKSVKSNPNLGPAELDTVKELKDKLEQAIPFLHMHSAPVQQQPVTPQPTIPQRPQFAAPVTPNSVVLPAVPTILPGQ